MYGAYLIRLLKMHNPSISIRAWGGDKMKAAGADVVVHISELSIMGFVEVVKNLARLRKLFSTCQHQILDFQTDTIVFIDFPGFNLRLAPWAKKNNIRTIQYVSPKVWAWKEKRIKKIKLSIDDLICIFPFEVDYYREHKIDVHYFGNPLHQLIDQYKQNLLGEQTTDMIALFPGSRKQEIRRILPILIQFALANPTWHFSIGGMSLIGLEYYKDIMGQHTQSDNLSLVMDKNYDLISAATLVINTSGTITLETALFSKPQIVVYKTHPISYTLIKSLIKINYISLPNILSQVEVVPELIQNELSVATLQETFDRLLSKESVDYSGLQDSLKVVNEEGLVQLITKGAK